MTGGATGRCADRRGRRLLRAESEQGQEDRGSDRQRAAKRVLRVCVGHVWILTLSGGGLEASLRTGQPGLEPGIAGFGDRCLSQLGHCPEGSDASRAAIVGAGTSMRAEGLEPPRAEAHQDLNLARLPIPPRPRESTPRLLNLPPMPRCRSQIL